VVDGVREMSNFLDCNLKYRPVFRTQQLTVHERADPPSSWIVLKYTMIYRINSEALILSCCSE
jgi:hypothetical protein